MRIGVCFNMSHVEEGQRADAVRFGVKRLRPFAAAEPFATFTRSSKI
jgi:hypothetical protein